VELFSLTVHETRDLLQTKQVSPKEVAESLIRRIERIDSAIHGYLSFDGERALKEAELADVSLPLGGVPIAIKDVISVQGHPCGCASKILQGYVAPYDATVIGKLRAAGAIPFGRANMDEFAMGSSTENSAFGPSHNPWDLERTPGGSSGGAAAVVAADEALAALGSDTGGSIRFFIYALYYFPKEYSSYRLIKYLKSRDNSGLLSNILALIRGLLLN
jgi:aspartyl-tRNA(Asn)/glutamyl-tRNA(Gln) amidotransferase subunit A